MPEYVHGLRAGTGGPARGRPAGAADVEHAAGAAARPRARGRRAQLRAGATFALLAGDARYLLVCVVMAAGSVGLSLVVRHRACARSGTATRGPATRTCAWSTRRCATRLPQRGTSVGTSKPRTRERRPALLAGRSPRLGRDVATDATAVAGAGRVRIGTGPRPAETTIRVATSSQAYDPPPSLRSRRRSPRWQRPCRAPCTRHCRPAGGTPRRGPRRCVDDSGCGAGLGGGARRDPPAGSTGAGRRRRTGSRTAVVRRLGVGAVAPAHRWAMGDGLAIAARTVEVRTGDLAQLLPQLLGRLGSPGPCRRTGRGGRRAARPDSGTRHSSHDRAGGGPGRRDRCVRRPGRAPRPRRHLPRPPARRRLALPGRAPRPDVAGRRRSVRAHARAAAAGPVQRGRRTDPFGSATGCSPPSRGSPHSGCRSVPTRTAVSSRSTCGRVPWAAAGPHGVLVGATGSGKSELLRSLVLALAARAGPAEVALVLVDYKGGATFDPVAVAPARRRPRDQPRGRHRRDRPAAGRARGRGPAPPAGAASRGPRQRPSPARGLRRVGTRGRQRARAGPAGGRRRVRRAARGTPRAARHRSRGSVAPVGRWACTCCWPRSGSTRAGCAGWTPTWGTGSHCARSPRASPRLCWVFPWPRSCRRCPGSAGCGPRKVCNGSAPRRRRPPHGPRRRRRPVTRCESVATSSDSSRRGARPRPGRLQSIRGRPAAPT